MDLLKKKLKDKGLEILAISRDGGSSIVCKNDVGRILTFHIIKNPIMTITLPKFLKEWILVDLFGEYYTVNVSELKIKMPKVKKLANYEMPLKDLLRLSTQL
jgi:hypothetical protein